jgi:hypothetical protein
MSKMTTENATPRRTATLRFWGSTPSPSFINVATFSMPDFCREPGEEPFTHVIPTITGSVQKSRRTERAFYKPTVRKKCRGRRLDAWTMPRNAVYKTRLLSLYEAKVWNNRTYWTCGTRTRNELAREGAESLALDGRSLPGVLRNTNK